MVVTKGIVSYEDDRSVENEFRIDTESDLSGKVSFKN